MALTLDQQQTDHSWGSVDSFQGYNGYYRAQTLTAGLSGALERIDLWIGKLQTPPGGLVVEVRTVSGDLPTSTVLATQIVPESSITHPWNPGGEIEVTFSTPTIINLGTKYAIVIYQEGDQGDGNNKYFRYGASNNPYSDGRGCYSIDSGANWVPHADDEVDIYFQTYVEPAQEILENIINDFRSLKLWAKDDIIQDFRMAGTFVTANVSNDFRLTGATLLDIINDFRMAGTFSLVDVINDFRSRLTRESVIDVINRFNLAKAKVYNIINDIRTHKKGINDISNDFRMIASWQIIPH